MTADANRLDAILSYVRHEYLLAREQHSPMNSGHEGWAVIKEGLDELWDHVRNDTATGNEAQNEAIQVAAMAVAFALEVCDDESPCTFRDCGKPENDPIHPGPDGQMGHGRHVFRVER